VGGENGVAFLFDTGPSGQPALYENFSVTDCFFSQVGGLAYNASSGSWWGAAIAFAARHAGVRVQGVTLAGNLVNGSDVFYSNSVPYAGFTRAYVAHLNISRNAITHNSYNVLFLDTTSFVSVQGNTFLADTPPRLFVAGTTDIIMGTLNASVAPIPFLGHMARKALDATGCAPFSSAGCGVGAGGMLRALLPLQSAPFVRQVLWEDPVVYAGGAQEADRQAGQPESNQGCSGCVEWLGA
jgi:hypothetical protein